MASGRPPRAAVRAAVRECLRDLEPGDRVVVALSGGADSLALTAAAVAVGAEIGLLCEAVVVDHQLQPGSGEVAARAAEQAHILGCSEARVLAVDVARGAGSGGVEAAARSARYAALDVVAAELPPAAAILLGHTREDQAETVLLGLARGSGTRSLAGMTGRTGIYRRPLLDLPRGVVVAAALEAAVADPRLEPWSDPHNTDTGFARVRVREDALPVLEAALGPGIVEALARTATLAHEDADALDAWADQIWTQLRRPTKSSALARTPARHQRGNELPLERQGPSELVAPDGPGGGEWSAAPATPELAGSRSGDPFGLASREGPDPEWITDPSRAGAPAAHGGGPRPRAGGPGPTSRPIGARPIGVLPIDVLMAPTPASPVNPDGGPLPAAIVNRVVRRFLIEAGCPRDSLTAGHIRAVAALLDAGHSPRAEVALPGGRRARREAGAVVVRV